MKSESVIDIPRSELCPDVWEHIGDSYRLIPNVKERLLNLAKQICDLAKLNFNHMDVRITGSITSNQYTDLADIDMHFQFAKGHGIREFSEITQRRFKDAVDQLKKSGENLYIGKHPIEVYYQPNKFQDYMSIGCYDLKNDVWLVGPELKDLSYDPYSDLYKDIQKKSHKIIEDVRNIIFDVYEKAVVFTKVHKFEPSNELSSNEKDIAQHAFSDLRESLHHAKDLYEQARNTRKIQSSPNSIEQALKFRNDKNWKIADASFKLMDKFGYLAILKKYAELVNDIDTGDGDLSYDVATTILDTVKEYINNPDKLAEKECIKSYISECVKIELKNNAKMISERWEPKYDDMPYNQWGEKWVALPPNHYVVCHINSIAKDCEIDPSDDDTKIDRLNVDSVHAYSNGNLIVTVFGGANGGTMPGKCNFEIYLALAKKFISKLTKHGSDPMFEDAWLVDWDNDCLDDVWTLRFCLALDKDQLQKFKDCTKLPKDDESTKQTDGLNESKKPFDPQAYVEEFKDYFGYRDEYSPTKSYGDAADSLAHECALEMPTDTAAEEIEGDAVMMLVLSGKEKAVEAGKALGDCMMKKTKHDQKTLLKRMKEAWGELSALQPLEKLPVTKVWIDDVRPAPNGYEWYKSVNSFIDHFSKDAPYLDNLGVVDIDHDAGDYAKDGGDYIKCLDYLEHNGVKDLQVRIHSQNPVGVAKMRQIIKKNGWKEIFDIYESKNKTLSKALAAIISLLAIKNILPAATLETSLKNKPLNTLTVNSPEIKETIAELTIGDPIDGMNITNVVNALTRTLYAEAKGEGEDGQAAVASVIWNRAGGDHRKLVEVISKPWQFSCWNDKIGTNFWNDKNYKFMIPNEVFRNNNQRKIWDYCHYLAISLINEEFTSTIGNFNAYLNKNTAKKKALNTWGKKCNHKLGNHWFGYLPEHDGFKKNKQPTTQSSSTYVVKKGDTLVSIANKHNTSVKAIMQKNMLNDPNKISVGQKLKV